MFALLLLFGAVAADGSGNYSDQFLNDWRCGRVPPPACPDDDGPPGSFGLGDLVCALVACKRVPGWIATRPCNTHLIGGKGFNGTCSYSALSADGNTTLVACGASPTYQNNQNCICSQPATTQCQCTYSLRLNASAPNAGPPDSFGECSSYNSSVLAFRACSTLFQPNATYTHAPTPVHTTAATTTHSPTTASTHDSGTLNGGPPPPPATCPNCDDGDPCTVDSCNTHTGVCNHALTAGCCSCRTDCPTPDVCHSAQCSVNSHHKRGGSGGNGTCDVTRTGNCTAVPIAGCCVKNSDCALANVCQIATCNTNTHRCNAPTPFPCPVFSPPNRCQVPTCTVSPNNAPVCGFTLLDDNHCPGACCGYNGGGSDEDDDSHDSPPPHKRWSTPSPCTDGILKPNCSAGGGTPFPGKLCSEVTCPTTTTTTKTTTAKTTSTSKTTTKAATTTSTTTSTGKQGFGWCGCLVWWRAGVCYRGDAVPGRAFCRSRRRSGAM